MLTIPSQDELHREYRETRIKLIWGACREHAPDIYTFKDMAKKTKYFAQEEMEIVVLKLDVLLDGKYHFDGEKTVSISSTAALDDGLFFALSKIGRHLVFSIDLLRNDDFIDVFIENRMRFWTIQIWCPDKLDWDRLEGGKLYKAKPWKFRPKYKATAADIRKEFKYRLKETYSPVFGNGLGLLLCMVTCPIGALMLVAGLVVLPIDAVATGINYSILKRREKI